MKNNILITGATGFIGQNLISYLFKNKDRNYQLTALVRNLKKAQKLPYSLSKIKIDLGKNNLFSLRKFNQVIHLASDLNYFGDYSQLYKTNVLGTHQLIKNLPNLSHFIYISSMEAAQPKTAYGKTKKEAEELVIKFAKKIGFKFTILRLGNVYGKNNPFIFTELKNLIVNKNSYLSPFYPYFKDIKIFPVFIEDVVLALTKILKEKISGQFNFLGENSYTIEKIIKIMIKELNLKCYQNNHLASPWVLKIRNFTHRLFKKADFLDYLLNKAEEKEIKKVSSFPWSYKINLNQGIKLIFQKNMK